MKVYRYTVWLLMICFSAYLGHNLVPHHHHGEAFPNPMAGSCPENHIPGKHPIHCHAFNDTVFEKFQIQVFRPLYAHHLITTVSCTDPIPAPAISQESDGTVRPALLHESVECYGSPGLRGPPTAA